MTKSYLMLLRDASISLNKIPIFSNVYMDVFKHEITSLVYENDIEREALIQLLTGNITLDSGNFIFHNNLCNKEPFKKKVWVIGEETNLSRSLTIEDHIFNFSYGKIHIATRNYEKPLKELFKTFHISISPHTKIEKLTKLQKIQIELLMAFVSKKECVIISNISLLLSTTEINELSSLIIKMQEYKSNFLILDNYENMLHTIADRVYIMKNGQVIHCIQGKEMRGSVLKMALNPAEGGAAHQSCEAVELREKQDAVLTFKHVSTNHFENINLKIHKGEIIKFFYTDRYCAKQFVNVFQGLVPLREGGIIFGNKEFAINSYEDALKQKIGFVPINPIANMLFPELSVKTNLFYPVSRKAPEVLRYFRFEKSIMQVLEEDIPSGIYNIKVKNLSPLNQISIVYGKWYLYYPKILICINPFPNYNIEMDKITQKWIRRLAERGTAVLIIASDWPSHLTLESKTRYIEEGNIR